MEKVFVVGGSGRVGTALIQDLLAEKIEVVAAARHPEKIMNDEHVTALPLDLRDSTTELANKMIGTDAVYFVAGSRGKDLLQTDAMGAIKTMQAAERANIKRYIMLSSMYSLQPEMWHRYPALAKITDYNTAKFLADHFLIHDTTLDYTILQPATLTEKPATGKVTFGESKGGDPTNTISDVAMVLAKLLNAKNTIHKVIMMRNGDTPIDQAIANVK